MSDTQGAIAGSIAWSYYRFGKGFDDSPDDFMSDAKPGRISPQSCEDVVSGYHINELLPCDFAETIEEFDRKRAQRAEAYERVGNCTAIPL